MNNKFIPPVALALPEQLPLSAFGSLSNLHQRINFLGLPLDAGIMATDVCELLRSEQAAGTITFINPYAWAVAKQQTDYLTHLQRIMLVLPDGEGVARAYRLLTKNSCPRVSFDMSSLAGLFFETAQQLGRTMMLVGGKNGVGEAVRLKLRSNYKQLQLLATLDGYGGFEPKITAILTRRPNIVLVGMGTPYQERFIVALQEAGYQGLAITCGGFLDQYLLNGQYYPHWIDKLNLRFGWRLYKEPKRLWRRYLIDYQVMIIKFSFAMFNKHKSRFLK